MADRLHAMLRSRLRPGIGKRLRVFTGWLSVSAPASLFLQSSSSSSNNQWTLHYRLAIPSPPPSSMWDDFLNPPPTCIIFSRRPIFYCLHMPRNCKITHLYHELYSILANSCFRYNRKVYSPRILYSAAWRSSSTCSDASSSKESCTLKHEHVPWTEEERMTMMTQRHGPLTREAPMEGMHRHRLEAPLRPLREGASGGEHGLNQAPRETPRAGMLAVQEHTTVLRDSAPGHFEEGPPWCSCSCGCSTCQANSCPSGTRSSCCVSRTSMTMTTCALCRWTVHVN
jgi:hypothetical protein